MEKQIARQQKCFYIRNGVEIWIDIEKAEDIQKYLRKPSSEQFIEVDGRTLNKADLTGVFLPIDLEELKRRKLGQWKCDKGTWHRKDEDCECAQNIARQKQSEMMRENSKPMDPAQIKKNRKILKNMREDLISKKIIK
jgi:hypothetical protein